MERLWILCFVLRDSAYCLLSLWKDRCCWGRGSMDGRSATGSEVGCLGLCCTLTPLLSMQKTFWPGILAETVWGATTRYLQRSTKIFMWPQSPSTSLWMKQSLILSFSAIRLKKNVKWVHCWFTNSSFLFLCEPYLVDQWVPKKALQAALCFRWLCFKQYAYTVRSWGANWGS